MFPTKRKINPCTVQFIHDHPSLFMLANGNVSNGKRGLKNLTIKSVYSLAITMWKDGFIVRERGEYVFVNDWHGLKYPFCNK